MTFDDLIGDTSGMTPTRLSEIRIRRSVEEWRERRDQAEKIAEEERESTPRSWTWLHGGG